MPLQASDLKFYACEKVPEDNISLVGGDINTKVRVVFSDIVNLDTIDVFSTNATLAGVLTVWGRDANGDLVQENFTLDGENIVAGIQLFANVWRVCYPDASHTGSIYVQDNSTYTLIATLEDYVTGVIRVFQNTFGDHFGGDALTYYEKIFIKNNNASSSLIGAEISERSVGLYSIIDFGVENSLNAIQTIANRLAEPTGVVVYSDGPTSLIEKSYLPANEYQGIWLKLTMDPGDPVFDSYYGLCINGRSS